MQDRSACLLGIALVLAAPVRAAELVGDGAFDDPAHAAWTFEQADLTSEIAWSSEDAAGSMDSGSLLLRKAVGENPNSIRAQQCIDVVPGATYDASAAWFWPAVTDPSEGSPYFRIQWFSGPGCAGDPLTATDPFSFTPSIAHDAWVPFGPAAFDVPAAARSGTLYVGVVAYVSLGSPDFFEARWDAVSILPEAGGALPAIVALTMLARCRRTRR